MTDLTAEQSRAVASSAHALEIRAGAGTGKTTTLAHRLARMAQDGTPQHRLLAVTFTREATASLQRRLGTLLGKNHDIRVSSFHQWATRELRSETPQFLSQDEARRILLGALQRGPGGTAFSAAMGGGQPEEVVTRLQGFLSYVRNAETTVADAILRQFPNLARHETALVDVEEKYQQRKGDRLDFDDLLLLFRDRLRTRTFRMDVASRIDHLAVDEFQDVNIAQAEAVRLLTTGRGAPRVTIVGDPRQSIYGFRGSTPTHLERFLEAYGKRGRRLALTVSFRATRALVAAGNTVLPDEFALRARPRAPQGDAPILLGFADAKEEARAVADHAERLLAEGACAEDIAILYRSRPLAYAFTTECHERGGTLRDIPLTTIHAAKGLEWDHVILLGAREGGLPSEQTLRAEGDTRDRLLAEERRLLYVAATRARKTLLVTWARAPSRFLAPLIAAIPPTAVRSRRSDFASGGSGAASPRARVPSSA